MKNTGVIYKLENPNWKIYIGKAVDFNSRKWSYQNLKCKSQPALYNSLKKYGYSNHSVEILYEGDVTTLSDKEKYYINEYNTFRNPTHLNLTKGGDGAIGRKDSEETKKKRASHHIGSTRSIETRNKMSLSAKKRGVNRTGSLSDEHKRKISISQKNHSNREDINKKRVHTRTNNRFKKFGYILQFDMDNNLVKKWKPNITEIAKNMKCDPSTIRDSLKTNDVVFRVGYNWRYEK